METNKIYFLRSIIFCEVLEVLKKATLSGARLVSVLLVRLVSKGAYGSTKKAASSPMFLRRNPVVALMKGIGIGS